MTASDLHDSKAPRTAWAKTLAEMCDVVATLFTRRGRSAEAAQSDARAVVVELANFFGGRMVYLPRGHQLRIALRDAELWARFNGTNVAALAEEYQLTTIHVYAILRKQRALRRAERAEPHRMPPDDVQ